MILDPQSKPGPDDVTPEEERRRVAKDRDELERTQRKTIGVLALLALAVVAWIASPVAVGILLGTLMAFTMQPLYERQGFKIHGAHFADTLSARFLLLGFCGDGHGPLRPGRTPSSVSRCPFMQRI